MILKFGIGLLFVENPVPKLSVEVMFMQYLASHYWQSADENSPSLLLQQVYYKRKRLPVLLACVCNSHTDSDFGKSLMRGLTDWFYETGLPFAALKGEKGIWGLRRKAEGYLRKEKGIPEDLELSGILCVGSSFVMWKRGEGKIWFVNQRNQHAQITELHPMLFQNGFLQRNVGLILGTGSFGQPQPVNGKQWQEESQVKEYLRQMGTGMKAGEGKGAVMLVTK